MKARVRAILDGRQPMKSPQRKPRPYVRKPRIPDWVPPTRIERLAFACEIASRINTNERLQSALKEAAEFIRSHEPKE